MLAVYRPNGMVTTVLPHGMLFRRGHTIGYQDFSAAVAVLHSRRGRV